MRQRDLFSSAVAAPRSAPAPKAARAVSSPAAPTDTAAAAPGPDHPPCPRCGSQEVRDAEIHGGRSTRRDCRRCNLFLYFTRWYGQPAGAGPAASGGGHVVGGG